MGAGGLSPPITLTTGGTSCAGGLGDRSPPVGRRTFANLVAPPIDVATNRLVRCKVRLLFCLTDVKNCVQIDPLYLFSRNAAKLTKKHGFELGVLLWRHLTLERKSVIWMHNYTPSGVQVPQIYSGKFTSCMTFNDHKHVRSEPFLDYLHEV